MAQSLDKRKRFSGPERPIPLAVKGQIDFSALPTHVAIIMDGNGRWARSKGLPRIAGHRAGAKTVREVVEASREIGIRYLTLYTFSNENWKRPQDEVQALMNLLRKYVRDELDEMLHYGIGMNVMGQIDMLPPKLQAEVRETVEKTAHCDKMTVILALSYSGRMEIVEATREIAARCRSGELQPSDIDEKVIGDHLYLPTVPSRTCSYARAANAG